VELLSWDTSFFGLTIGRARAVDGRDVEAALTEAEEHGAACLYVVVPGAKAEPVAAAIRVGGALTALRFEFERTGESVAAQPVTVRRATAEDAAQVADLAARLAPTSRFAQDERFRRERVEEMYRIWALNDLRDGKVLVDVTGGRGMVALSRRPPGYSVDLVFVADGARGTGLGRDLLEAAAAEANGSQLTVATDARNVLAVRLYEASGFRARALDAVLHVWLDASG
jgi:GNAT superfamily N-acetyltransferase